MVVQHGIKLAVHIVKSHFGDLVAKVCECLLRKGTLTFLEILRYSELPSRKVTVNCILVLIQHNCVQAFAIERQGSFGVKPRIITQYTVIFENILHRLRFSKFLAIVKEEFGEECEEVLIALLQHGRLTLEQFIFRAKEFNKEFSKESFDSLVNARYVERCPLSEPFLSPCDETPPTKKRKFSFTGEITEEQRAIAAAIPSEAERFLVIIDTKTDVTSEAITKENTPNVKPEEKHELLETDSTMSTIYEKETLWRVNFEEFTRRLRHKACVANVRKRFDDGAAIVLNAILYATGWADKRVKIEKSVPLSMIAILDEVMKSEAGHTMNSELVQTALSQLGCHPSRGSDEPYSVGLKKIIETAQNEEVESVVLKRYGRDAFRIFRLLAEKDCLLPTKEISEITFVDKEEALKTLYKLWEDDYLNMEKTTAKESTQVLLLWKVNTHFVRTHILDIMYHAAINLSLRIAFEHDQALELRELPKEKLKGNERQRYFCYLKAVNLLESSLMKLDDALMLFLDF